MPSQWIWRITYIIFIGFVTIIVTTFSEATKVVNFLGNNQSEFMSDDRMLIAATVIANNRDSTDAYVLATPLYYQTFDNEVATLSVSIYPLVEFKGSKANNAIAILVNTIEINDELALKDGDNYHIIQAEIVFDRDIQVGQQNKRYFEEYMTPLYDDTGRLIIIKEELLQTSTGIALFQSISITYQVTGATQTLVTLSNSELTNITPNDLFDLSINRDLILMTEENVDLLSQFGLNSLSGNNSIYYNPDLITEFNRYNRYYFIYIGIEFLFVLPITYFLFFHKYIRRNIREKRMLNTNTST